jgi:structural maintenance of chromosome 1
LTQLEAEVAEKLEEISLSLLYAKVDVRESEKAAKFRETVSNLKRLYPGLF